MSWLKWALVGGASYLGYRALTHDAETATLSAGRTTTVLSPVAPLVQQLIARLRLVLQPVTWELTSSAAYKLLTYRSRPDVTLERWDKAKLVQSQSWPTVQTALAWANAQPLTGKGALVNWSELA